MIDASTHVMLSYQRAVGSPCNLVRVTEHQFTILNIF